MGNLIWNNSSLKSVYFRFYFREWQKGELFLDQLQKDRQIVLQVLRVDRQILRVERRVLRVDKWVLRMDKRMDKRTTSGKIGTASEETSATRG